MDPSAVEWGPAFVVLAAGLLLGAAFIWRVYASGRVAAAPAVPVEVRDLEGKRDALFQQLRELEDTAAKRRPEQLASERYALELDAARVLQELDALAGPAERGRRKEAARARRAAAPVPGDEAVPAPAGSPAMRGFLWGIGSAAALALLVFFVAQAARPRTEGAPVTGDVGAPSSGEPAPGGAPLSAEETELRAAVERNPDDLEARLDLARFHLGRQDLMAVWNETQFVLQRVPGNARALSYQALVRLAMGQPDVAEGMLEQAQASAPDLLEPYLHLALVYTRTGREDEAERVIADASRRFPAQAKGIERLLDEMRAQAQGPAALEGDPHAGVPPPASGAGNGAAPSSPATSGGGRRIAGVVDLDPSIKGSTPTGGIVFVMVRDASFGAGPPLAAKRLVASRFPLPFEISQADSMTGEDLPADLLVEARLDADGDPVTRPPTDPKGRLEDVKAGSTGLRVVLRR